MAVCGHVHAENQTREVHMHTRIKAANKPTIRLTKVGPKAVERNPKCRNVDYISNQETLAIKGNDGGAPTKDWSVRIVSHPNPKIPNRLV
jgi:hypothetical protein